MIVTVKVTPGAPRTCVKRFENGILYVAVAAPPEKGRANDALVDFVAEQFGLKKQQVQIVSGQTSRLKRLQIPVEEQQIQELRPV